MDFRTRWGKLLLWNEGNGFSGLMIATRQSWHLEWRLSGKKNLLMYGHHHGNHPESVLKVVISLGEVSKKHITGIVITAVRQQGCSPCCWILLTKHVIPYKKKVKRISVFLFIYLLQLTWAVESQTMCEWQLHDISVKCSQSCLSGGGDAGTSGLNRKRIIDFSH